MKKILSVIGTRPNFIKLAALNKTLPKNLKHIVVHTGQHYDKNLYADLYKDLGLIKPQYNLAVGSKPDHTQIAQMFQGLVKVFVKEKPLIVLIYGDTNSSLAGALAASYKNIPIGHIEAGIRCFDDSLPEEVNRKIIDRLSTLLFCPTKTGYINLRKENLQKGAYVTGDIMYDLFLKTKQKHLVLPATAKDFYLATIHRQQNTANAKILTKTLDFLNNQNNIVIFPIHPRTKSVLGNPHKVFGNIIFINPVNYSESLYLISNAALVITDSGGIQKEAYWSKTPCFTIRTSTEWPETLEGGANSLINISHKKIIRPYGLKFNKHKFGDGHAAKKIAALITSFVNAS